MNLQNSNSVFPSHGFVNLDMNLCNIKHEKEINRTEKNKYDQIKMNPVN